MIWFICIYLCLNSVIFVYFTFSCVKISLPTPRYMPAKLYRTAKCTNISSTMGCLPVKSKRMPSWKSWKKAPYSGWPFISNPNIQFLTKIPLSHGSNKIVPTTLINLSPKGPWVKPFCISTQKTFKNRRNQSSMHCLQYINKNPLTLKPDPLFALKLIKPIHLFIKNIV